MEYAMKILHERAVSLQTAYFEFVKNGSVSTSSYAAVDNREKYNSCINAVVSLAENVYSESDLRTAYEDGCKYQSFEDLKSYLIEKK